ncbi:MAG: ABC transporter substrate-binding protein [Paracoccaceae bacterium]|nr:ABC transporter substrate-binding protein [Paracoccaceae bacterium]
MLLHKPAIASIVAIGLSLSTMGFGTIVQAQDKVHFQTDWLPSGEHAMYYGGWTKGFWADQGIDVTITRGYGSGDTVTKIATGAADFGVADFGAVLTAKAKTGVPVRTISFLYTHSPHSLFVLESSGIDSFKGLEGKNIGITPGNSHKVYFPNVAERAGTDPTKLNWVLTDGAAMAPLLIAKQIDAAPFYSMHHYYQNKAAESAGEKIKVLPFEEVGFAIYSASLITSQSMIDENPDLVRRFLTAAQNSFNWAKENPDEACKLHVERVPEVAFDDCMGSLSATLKFVFNDHSAATGLGKFDTERLAFTWKVVSEAQSLDASWDPAQSIDVSHLPN